MTSRHRDLGERLADVARDVSLTLARADEAIELLNLWSEQHPDDHLARASRNLIRRFNEDPS